MLALGVAREEGSVKLHTAVQRDPSPPVQSQLCPALKVLVVSGEELCVSLSQFSSLFSKCLLSQDNIV